MDGAGVWSAILSLLVLAFVLGAVVVLVLLALYSFFGWRGVIYTLVPVVGFVGGLLAGRSR